MTNTTGTAAFSTTYRPPSGAWSRGVGSTIQVALVALSSPAARADENGVSFRVPGFFGSLAATPQQPGWSVTSIYYHTDVNANVAPRADIGFIAPSYVFATPFLGGKAYARASR